MRRKFEQELGNDPPRAQYAMEQIGRLYTIERQITDEELTKEQAERTAMIYSLLGTCKVCGVNPTAWLSGVLSRIQDHSVQRLDELLPNKLAQARLAAACI